MNKDWLKEKFFRKLLCSILPSIRENMTCNDLYSAPRRPYNEFIQDGIYRNILFKRNELTGTCRVHREVVGV